MFIRRNMNLEEISKKYGHVAVEFEAISTSPPMIEWETVDDLKIILASTEDFETDDDTCYIYFHIMITDMESWMFTNVADVIKYFSDEITKVYLMGLVNDEDIIIYEKA